LACTGIYYLKEGATNSGTRRISSRTEWRAAGYWTFIVTTKQIQTLLNKRKTSDDPCSHWSDWEI
jgi:hypothetical protein